MTFMNLILLSKYTIVDLYQPNKLKHGFANMHVWKYQFCCMFYHLSLNLKKFSSFEMLCVLLVILLFYLFMWKISLKSSKIEIVHVLVALAMKI